ncbi:MAG: hypothetical protein HFJ37_04235 [Clostridia bacterium]|nr:hypothetical protein [Clostridia bacterium]
MEEKEERKINTDALKSEASTTVNQVKDTIKNVDIKKDSIETKGFVLEMAKDPLGKIKEIVNENNGKFLKYAIIIIVIWSLAVLVKECFDQGSFWDYYDLGNSIKNIITTTITPIISILVMSLVIFLMNKKNKKSLTTIMTVVTSANIPIAIAGVVNLLTIMSRSASVLTTPFSKLCRVITAVLMYFTIKTILGAEKNSEFIKKFVLIEGIYYIAYIVMATLSIYIY